MPFSWWVYPLLFATGFGAGLVDSIAGGGGIISLPVLLNLGLPPALALGTNKLQGTFGSTVASAHYVRHRIITLRECGLGILCTLIGALMGTLAVQHLDPHLLEKCIPWLLTAIIAYSIFRPQVGEHEQLSSMNHTAFYILFGLSLGFYDGFFGPGVGSFWTMAYVLALGWDFRRATGGTKVMNCTSNVASLALFALAGQVQYTAGLVMAAGQVAGSRIGAGLVVKKGARFVRPIFLTIAALTLLRLIYHSLSVRYAH